MVRISSSSMSRNVVLILLIALGTAAPRWGLAEKDEVGRSRADSPPKERPSKPEVREPESEYEQIETPFGTIRRQKSKSRDASNQVPAAQESPASSVSQDPPITPAEAEAGQRPPASVDAGVPQEEPGPAPETSRGSQPAGRSGQDPEVRFSCANCSLLEFLRNIAGELELNYVVDPRVEGSVDIHTFGEMSRSDLMPLLETVLEINGAAIVRTGAVYRILPSGNAKQLPLEVRRDPGHSGAATGENRVLQVVPMHFVSAVDVAELLTPYLSDGGNISFHPTANFLVIADTPGNVRKLLELVRVFDSDAFGSQRVRLFPIENSRATSLVQELQSIFAGYAQAEASSVRFIPVARLNSVLAIGPNPDIFTEVERWVTRLDQAGRIREIRNYFVKIQNGDAVAIAGLLRQIYGTGRRIKDEELASPGSADSAAPEESQEELLQGEIKIVADDRNNALIVQCSAQDFEVLEETIRELDRVPRQVLINVKIYEVELDDELSMGISAFLQARNQPIVRPPSATSASFGTGGGESPGLNLATKLLSGHTRELVAFLNAQETRNRSRVLSAPSVIASDNVEANIQVGSQIPVLTSQGVVPGGTGGSSLFSNTIQNRNTGVILNVTPRINSGGWVTLSVQQEVSSPGPPPSAGIQSPSINIRSVATQVTIKNGQTIALGGIISESNGLSRNRIPLLGRIPGIGVLFGNTTRKKSRTELIALITPHVIEDIEQASDLTEELKSTLKGLRKELMKSGDQSGFHRKNASPTSGSS